MPTLNSSLAAAGSALSAVLGREAEDTGKFQQVGFHGFSPLKCCGHGLNPQRDVMDFQPRAVQAQGLFALPFAGLFREVAAHVRAAGFLPPPHRQAHGLGQAGDPGQALDLGKAVEIVPAQSGDLALQAADLRQRLRQKRVGAGRAQPLLGELAHPRQQLRGGTAVACAADGGRVVGGARHVGARLQVGGAWRPEMAP